MSKHFEEWNGNHFPVRSVYFPVCEGMETWVNVADYDLWAAIEEDYNNGNTEAHALDNDIYFYCDSGYIESDPTDEEIIQYLIEHEC